MAKKRTTECPQGGPSPEVTPPGGTTLTIYATISATIQPTTPPTQQNDTYLGPSHGGRAAGGTYGGVSFVRRPDYVRGDDAGPGSSPWPLFGQGPIFKVFVPNSVSLYREAGIT